MSKPEFPETIHVVREQDEDDDSVWYNVLIDAPTDMDGEAVAEYRLVQTGIVSVTTSVAWTPSKITRRECERE